MFVPLQGAASAEGAPCGATLARNREKHGFGSRLSGHPSPMSRSLVLVAGLAGTGMPAGAAVPPKKRCGTTPRAFTDGSPAVYVAAGTTSCTTAKSVMRRYWKSDPSGSRKQSHHLQRRPLEMPTRHTVERARRLGVPEPEWALCDHSSRVVTRSALPSDTGSQRHARTFRANQIAPATTPSAGC